MPEDMLFFTKVVLKRKNGNNAVLGSAWRLVDRQVNDEIPTF
jgi:hypothetical protein